MKKIIAAAAFSVMLWSCGGANDGNPATDTTTTIPPDPALMNNGDSVTINSNVNTDSGANSNNMDSGLPAKNDVRSSSSAYPDGRGAKTNRDSSRQ